MNEQHLPMNEVDQSHRHREDPRIPGKGEYSEESRKLREEWVESFTGQSVSSLVSNLFPAQELRGNIENYLGTVAIPVGLAGPLLFDGDRAHGWKVAPMATTEGALIASTSRGATALSRSGGVRTRVLGQRLMRVPVFEFETALQGLEFTRWLAEHRGAIELIIGEVSSHAKLVELNTSHVGRLVHVSFVYETADAAGQNMTTATTWHALQWMATPLAAAGLTPRHMQIESAFSGDKRVSAANFLQGRGTRVVAEALLSAEVIRHVLKIEPEAMLKGARLMAAAGVITGEIGRTANAANLIAAMFTATGQDIACVHESSIGFLNIEPEGKDVYVSMTLPSLAIGSVGGGTHLPHQQECLAMLGCQGDDGGPLLAELIAGFALGLDLSLVSALNTNQFATAHERLGRNRPVEFLSASELDSERLVAMTNERGATPAPVIAANPISAPMSAGIITDLGTRIVGRKHVGMQVMELELATGERVPAVVKSKATDREVLTAFGAMSALLGPDLAVSWRLNEHHLGFLGLHTRELGLAQREELSIAALRPTTYGVWDVAEREIAVLVMEYLGEDVILMDTADTAGAWSAEDITAALTGIAAVHAEFLGRPEVVTAQDWFGPVPTLEEHAAAMPMYLAVTDHAADEYPDWFPEDRAALWRACISHHPTVRQRLSRRPQTLIHHDFNTRNSAIRLTPHGRKLVLWDWELATEDVPQRDVAEFLAFSLTDQVEWAELEGYMEIHRTALANHAGQPLDDPAAVTQYRQDFADALLSFASTRLLHYVMANEARDFRFLGRLIATTARMLELLGITHLTAGETTMMAELGVSTTEVGHG